MPSAQDLSVRYDGAIVRAVRLVCRRHGIRGPQAEDFGQDAYVKALDCDAALLRRLNGHDGTVPYLVRAFERLWTDQLRATYGRWRPSAAATRAGAAAVELERHIVCDGLSEHEAVQSVLCRLNGTTSERDLEALLARLDPKKLPTLVAVWDHPSLAGRASFMTTEVNPEVLLLRRKERAGAAQASAAFHEALDALRPADRQLLAARADGASLGALASQAGVRWHTLRDRLRRLIAEVGAAIAARAVSPDEVHALLATRAFADAGDAPLPCGRVAKRSRRKEGRKAGRKERRAEAPTRNQPPDARA